MSNIEIYKKYVAQGYEFLSQFFSISLKIEVEEKDKNKFKKLVEERKREKQAKWDLAWEAFDQAAIVWFNMSIEERKALV